MIEVSGILRSLCGRSISDHPHAKVLDHTPLRGSQTFADCFFLSYAHMNAILHVYGAAVENMSNHPHRLLHSPTGLPVNPKSAGACDGRASVRGVTSSPSTAPWSVTAAASRRHSPKKEDRYVEAPRLGVDRRGAAGGAHRVRSVDGAQHVTGQPARAGAAWGRARAGRARLLWLQQSTHPGHADGGMRRGGPARHLRRDKSIRGAEWAQAGGGPRPARPTAAKGPGVPAIAPRGRRGRTGQDRGVRVVQGKPGALCEECRGGTRLHAVRVTLSVTLVDQGNIHKQDQTHNRSPKCATQPSSVILHRSDPGQDSVRESASQVNSGRGGAAIV